MIPGIKTKHASARCREGRTPLEVDILPSPKPRGLRNTKELQGKHARRGLGAARGKTKTKEERRAINCWMDGDERVDKLSVNI